MYSLLDTELKTNVKNKFILGDFNGTVGDSHDNYPDNIGNFGNGETNFNGKLLVDLLGQNDLYINNTFFDHKLAHVNTWTSNLKLPHRRNPIRKQIDFIISHINWRCCNTDARAYSGTKTFSDHRLVISKYKNIKLCKIHKKKNATKIYKVNHLKNCTEQYQDIISSKINNVISNNNQEHWSSICDILISAAEETKPPEIKKNQIYNESIAILSEQQKRLRIKIEGTKNVEKRQTLKTLRNAALHSIKREQTRVKNEQFTDIIEEINK